MLAHFFFSPKMNLNHRQCLHSNEIDMCVLFCHVISKNSHDFWWYIKSQVEDEKFPRSTRYTQFFLCWHVKTLHVVQMLKMAFDFINLTTLRMSQKSFMKFTELVLIDTIPV